MAIYRIETVMDGVDGSPYFSRLHCLAGFGDDPVTAASAHSAVVAMWEGLREHMRDDLRIVVQPEVSVLDDATRQQVGSHTFTSTAQQGQAPGQPLPEAVQALVQWRTGLFRAGREVRGRMFVPGLTVAAAVDGGLNNLVRLEIQQHADVLAQFDPSFIVASSAGNYDISRATVWNEFAILRSRRD